MELNEHEVLITFMTSGSGLEPYMCPHRAKKNTLAFRRDNGSWRKINERRDNATSQFRDLDSTVGIECINYRFRAIFFAQDL